MPAGAAPGAHARPSTCLALGVATLLAFLMYPAGLATAQAPEGPDLDVIATVVPLPAKSRVTTFVFVENDGPGVAREIRATVRPVGGDLIVLGSAERNLEDLDEGDDGSIFILLATGERTGGASLEVRLDFVDGDGARRRVTREVNLQIAPAPSDPLFVDHVPKRLVAGEEGNLTFVVHNEGLRAIRSLDLDLLVVTSTLGGLANGLGLGGGDLPLSPGEPDLTPGGRGTPLARGRVLEPGERVTVSAPVRTSLRSDDLLFFSIVASYDVEGFERTQRFDYGARVEGSVRLRVLDAREADAGAGLEVTGVIVNTGTGTAWNPRIRLEDGSAYESDGPRLVGDLEPNEPVSFRIPARRVGDGPARIVVEWNDEYGEVHERVAEAAPTLLPPPAPGLFAGFFNAMRAFTGFVTEGWARWALVILGLVALLALARYMRGHGKLKGRAH